MDAVTKVNTYFPSTTWTSFSVLANLVVNNATACTDTQFIVLWVLIALFCFFNFALCFTDSITRDAYPREDKNNDKKDDPARLPALQYFEVGDGRLNFQDFAQAILTTGTFLTLAILNTAYVACVFPNYDPFAVVESTQGIAPPPPGFPGPAGRKLLQNVLPTRIDPTVVRAIPTIVAFFVSGLLSFFKKPRHTVGYVPTNQNTAYVPADQNPALMTPKQRKEFDEKKKQSPGDASKNNEREAADASGKLGIPPGAPTGPSGSLPDKTAGGDSPAGTGAPTSTPPGLTKVEGPRVQ